MAAARFGIKALIHLDMEDFSLSSILTDLSLVDLTFGNFFSGYQKSSKFKTLVGHIRVS